MKCPCCDSEMEQGYIQSQRPIIWSATKKHFAIIPDNNTDVGVTGESWGGCYAPSFLCRVCNKLIVEPQQRHGG